MKCKVFASVVLAALAVFSGVAAFAADEVNLYSARKENLIKPLLDRFTKETGIHVNLVTGKADVLLKRLISEAANSPADLLVTTDAGRLHRAKVAGVTQAIDSVRLFEAVPKQYRDPQGHWVGLSLRARPIMYAKDRVDPAFLSTYEDLAQSKWKGKICIRSSNNVYNQSLVASMMAANGRASVEAWARRFVGNFASPPKGGDRDQIKAVASGQCDIAVANTYYLVGMLLSKNPAEKAAAEKVAVFWPNQNDRGSHVNVSGAALLRSSVNRASAVRLLEFLVEDESQSWYANANGEYPLRADLARNTVLSSWGTFEGDKLNLSSLGELNSDAVKLMDRVGWR